MKRRKYHDRKYLERLRATPVFAECSLDELRPVAALVTEIRVPAGRVLTIQGRAGHECFVVLEGQAVVERDGMIVGTAVPGSVVGELALLDGGYRTATVTAATEMDVLVMSQTEFASLRALGARSIEHGLARAAGAHRAALARTEAPTPAMAGTG
jgi:CRP-like cAMP-binding protein